MGSPRPLPTPDTARRSTSTTSLTSAAAATQDAGLRLGLADDLRLIRTAIVKACLQCDLELAFDLAAYQLASAVFGGRPDGPLAIEITATGDVPDGVDPNDREAIAQRSPGARMLAAETADLKLDWLQAATPRERFLQFRALEPKERRRQLSGGRRPGAHAAARLRVPTPAPETEAVVETLDIPFHELYRPDLEHFWRRMGRPRDARRRRRDAGRAVRPRPTRTTGRRHSRRPWPPHSGRPAPPDSLKLADDARQRALRWAPPGFEPARAPRRASPVPPTSPPPPSSPAWMNG